MKKTATGTQFWVVTITWHSPHGDKSRISDARAYLTESGAKSFYGQTVNKWKELNSWEYSKYQRNYSIKFQEFDAGEGVVIKEFDNRSDEV